MYILNYKSFLNENVIKNPFIKSQVKSVVYHFTPFKFEKFDFKNYKRFNKFTMLDGFYFSNIKPTIKYKDFYILECFIDIKNPIIIDMNLVNETVDEILAIINNLIQNQEEYGNTLSNYIEFKKLDYEEVINYWIYESDGIILLNTNYAEHTKEYVVFENTNNKNQNVDEQIIILNSTKINYT